MESPIYSAECSLTQEDYDKNLPDAFDDVTSENVFELIFPPDGLTLDETAWKAQEDETDANTAYPSEVMSLRGRLADRAKGLALSVKRKVGLAETFVKTVYHETWRVCQFSSLPRWLQDNEYLTTSHRPPLPSFYACFRSIFRIHTETVNIWIHLLGCLLYIGLAFYFLSRPQDVVPLEAKLVFSTFFGSIIFCLSMSCLFHTLSCHSENMENLFGKLDYCGIAILIMGSCVSWLYYRFYSDVQYMMLYLTFVVAVGIAIIIVTLWDFVSGPQYRHHRAIMFAVFGISGAIPVLHHLLANDFFDAIYQPSVGWIFFSGVLYLLGAVIYVYRIPECYFPGKFDVWCQSHQIFHLLVVIAAFLHYCAIHDMAFCGKLSF